MFTKINHELNAILKQKTEQVNTEKHLRDQYIELFQQPNEASKGEGEMPTWSPNPAYMQSLMWIWQAAERYLNRKNLATDQALYDTFTHSREYKDFKFEHRRIFYGQLISLESQKPVTAFMLNVAHSHRQFYYPVPVKIYIMEHLADLIE